MYAKFNFILFLNRYFEKLSKLDNLYLFHNIGCVLKNTYTIFYHNKFNPDDRALIMLNRIMGMTYRSDNDETHNTA
jgi:hypothetical protein